MNYDSIAMHTLAAASVLGPLSGYIPPAVALLGAVFYIIQIYESKTAQDFIKRWRKKVDPE